MVWRGAGRGDTDTSAPPAVPTSGKGRPYSSGRWAGGGGINEVSPSPRRSPLGHTSVATKARAGCQWTRRPSPFHPPLPASASATDSRPGDGLPRYIWEWRETGGGRRGEIVSTSRRPPGPGPRLYLATPLRKTGGVSARAAPAQFRPARFLLVAKRACCLAEVLLLASSSAYRTPVRQIVFALPDPAINSYCSALDQ